MSSTIPAHSRPASAGSLDTGERTGFYVTDDGPGIPPGIRESVLEWGVTSDDDGTGFGLAIVRQIVDGHEWQIDVTESESGGARFEVSGVTIR